MATEIDLEWNIETRVEGAGGLIMLEGVGELPYWL
jgi:hypothetical protein